MTDETGPSRAKARSAKRKPAASPAAAKTPRPKRTKKSLGDDFLAAVRADFRIHGAGVLAEVRADKPDQYLKIVLSVLPKDIDVAINQLDTLSDILFEVIVRKFRPAGEE
ncbi:hypothetical protein FJ434_26080 [Mesorhizobium sp. B2-5-13]|uniref:hypothetical protein n=1 Tax=unclassified Mesorhizobium TaxID=325217 RepID=UPI00112A519C|nr:MULTISPECIES: hypothetical protein [unclassified Mesorhizobium]TPJ37638.1 hypothetical protein FJ432_24745 [Mesorhizobium sp. B2-6-5]TPJ76556.1 hypothetical protein FJ434_26080 [Mesorhizobium sp. B2-5-13]TPK42747.1 hypothetical protein FJ560_25745 [Mesorhizobium sp. B2-5-5]